MPRAKQINWTLIYYMIVLMLVLIANALFINYVSNLEKSYNQKILATQLVRYALLDIESSLYRGWDIGIRGYAITKDPNLLGPFNDAYDYKHEVFERLRTQMKLVDLSQNRIDTLETVIDSYGQYMSEMRDLVESEGVESFAKELKLDFGYTSWFAYNQQVVAIKASLNNELNKIEKRITLVQSIALYVQLFSAILAVVILILLYRRILSFDREKQVYIDQIKLSNKMLKDHQQNLENEVALKTKDLAQTNKELNDSIDEMRQIQSQMLQSEKMASLGTLTTGIAHEFNNALNYVKGGYQIALDLFKSNKGDAYQNEQSVIQQSVQQGVERMEKIVSSLQVFSNRDSQDVQTTDVNELVANARNHPWVQK